MDLEELKNILKGKVVILGMGNPLKGDEGAGSELARRLKDKLKMSVFDGGTAPENFLAEMISLRPDTLLLVEVVFTQEAGAVLDIFSPEDLSSLSLFKRDLSLKIFLDVMMQSLPYTDIYILAIKPHQNSRTGFLSEQVKETLDKLERFFIINYGRNS